MTELISDLDLELFAVPPELCAPPSDEPARPAAVISPWALLGINPQAPPEVIADACDGWLAATRERRRRAEAARDRGEPLLASLARRMRHPKPHAPDEQAPPPSNGAHAEHVTLRRPATHWDEQPAAHLIVEAGEDAGTAIALGPRPLRAGTDPDCDVVLPYQDACRWVEARLWPNGGRYILHALGDAPVRVNGQPAIWAVLEDGDVVELAGVALRFTHDAPAPDLLR